MPRHGYLSFVRPLVCGVESIQPKVALGLGFLTGMTTLDATRGFKLGSVTWCVGWGLGCQMIFLNVFSALGLLWESEPPRNSLSILLLLSQTAFICYLVLASPAAGSTRSIMLGVYRAFSIVLGQPVIGRSCVPGSQR